MAFIREPANLAKLKEALDTPGRILEPTREQLQVWYEEMNVAINAHYQQGALGDEPAARFPSISRDTYAKILEIAANAMEPVPLIKDAEFIADTLFCEWAYVVDLDEGLFEVYSDTYGGDVQTSRGKDKGVEHDGPSLMGKWKLDALPTRDELLKVEERHGDEDHSGD